MCHVYRAYDLTEGWEVAVKVLKASFASDPRVVERFRGEAESLLARVTGSVARDALVTYVLGTQQQEDPNRARSSSLTLTPVG